MQLLQLIAVTQRRPVLMRSQWPRTVPRWAPQFLLSNQGNVPCGQSFRSGGRFIQGEPGLAVVWTSHCNHLYRAHAHKAQKKRWFSMMLSTSCLLTWRARVLSLILSLTSGPPAAWWVSLSSWVGCVVQKLKDKNGNKNRKCVQLFLVRRRTVSSILPTDSHSSQRWTLPG